MPPPAPDSGWFGMETTLFLDSDTLLGNYLEWGVSEANSRIRKIEDFPVQANL